MVHMVRNDYHTRLPADHAEVFDRYVKDKKISTSEALRRAVVHYLAAEGYPVSAADGGSPSTGGLRSVLPLVAALYATTALLAALTAALQAVTGWAAFAPLQLRALLLSAAIGLLAVEAVRHTRLPEIVTAATSRWSA